MTGMTKFVSHVTGKLNLTGIRRGGLLSTEIVPEDLDEEPTETKLYTWERFHEAQEYLQSRFGPGPDGKHWLTDYTANGQAGVVTDRFVPPDRIQVFCCDGSWIPLLSFDSPASCASPKMKAQ